MFYYYILILHKKQKKLARRIIKGPLNSIFSKHFKMNLRGSEARKMNYSQMSTLLKLIQYHKKAFHEKLFRSTYSIL